MADCKACVVPSAAKPEALVHHELQKTQKLCGSGVNRATVGVRFRKVGFLLARARQGRGLLRPTPKAARV